MRAPKVQDSLSWGKRKSQAVAAEDAEIISAATSSLNKFANDGSFMDEILSKKKNDFDGSLQENVKSEKFLPDADKPVEMSANIKEQDLHSPSLKVIQSQLTFFLSLILPNATPLWIFKGTGSLLNLLISRFCLDTVSVSLLRIFCPRLFCFYTLIGFVLLCKIRRMR